MPQTIIKFLVAFEAIKNGETIEFGAKYVAPVEMHIPLIGDEVVLPMETATEKGFDGNIFTVLKRRFHYAGVTGAAGAVTLILSREQ